MVWGKLLLSEMITWQTLRILKLMLDATDFCKTYGLGVNCPKNSSKPKCLVFNNYTEEDRRPILFSIKISKVSKIKLWIFMKLFQKTS